MSELAFETVISTALDGRSRKALRNIQAKVGRHTKAIAAHRDALRALADDLEAILDSADRATEALETAADALSEYL